MFVMQKIHRKTCKNCYIIPVPTTIEYGNFRKHSSLNFTLFSLHLIQSFESQKDIEKVWEIKDMEKLPFLQAIYLQCYTIKWSYTIIWQVRVHTSRGDLSLKPNYFKKCHHFYIPKVIIQVQFGLEYLIYGTSLKSTPLPL